MRNSFILASLIAVGTALSSPSFAASKTAPTAGASAAQTPAPSSAATPAPAVASGKVVFPNSIPAEFSSLSVGKARMKACVAQYNQNKTTGNNGGLKWIQKGGGYWSECSKHLKALAPAQPTAAAATPASKPAAK